MNRFFSPTALFISTTYAIVLAVLLIAAQHVPDLEGKAAELLLIGLPWVLAFHGDNWLLYSIALLLNVATVYGISLTIIRTFSRK